MHSSAKAKSSTSPTKSAKLTRNAKISFLFVLSSLEKGLSTEFKPTTAEYNAALAVISVVLEIL